MRGDAGVRQMLGGILRGALCAGALVVGDAAVAAEVAPHAGAGAGAGAGQARLLLQALEQARVVDLSFTWDEASPIASVNPPYRSELEATHADTRGLFGDGGQLSFASEVQHWSGQHGAPSMDALGHIGRDGKLYGGVDAAAATADRRGVGRSGVGAHLGIDQFPTELLVNRGVLLDVARFLTGSDAPLAPGFEVTAQHLADTAAAQGVQLRPGDTVFIRTGWGRYFTDDPRRYAGGESPGLGVDGARYLVKMGARVVGNDTLTFERRPPVVTSPTFQVFPVHMLLVADHGVFIMENVALEELAAARAYEFVAVHPPLKLRGGTGSAVRAFALVPRETPRR